MDYTKIAKGTVNTLTGYSVGASVGRIISATVPRQENPILDAAVKVSVFVASWSVSGTIMKPVTAHTDEKIDELAQALKNHQS